MPDRAYRCYFARNALLPEGWARDVRMTVAANGHLTAIESQATVRADDEELSGPVIPALANVHSHAFQRTMAGLAEIAGPKEDSFWTWRETMYRIANTLAPEDVEAIAARLYVDMLKCGTAEVGEFHYLHHDRDGAPYANRAEMGERLIVAAGASGIAMTLMPTFYAHAGFGGKPPSAGQCRFINDIDGYWRLVSDLEPAAERANVRIGHAIHSLRAATPDEMGTLLTAASPRRPIHIHIAEQQQEVEDCRAWSGRTPVNWLLDEMPVDSRWCLIHATHADEAELQRIVAAGATIGLCPTTEASLGDGLFPATTFHKLGGRIAIGSDSHVSVDPAEELRLLEYSQRLRDERRARIVEGPGRSNGAALFAAVLAGGAQALGAPAAGIRVGAPARMVVLDERHPFIAAATGDQHLDRWIFALGEKAVRDVMVDGVWRVRDHHHENEERIDRDFATAVIRLAGS